MSKASAPAPDYTAAAQETAAGNLQNLQYQTQANRPTTVTPYGSDTWTQDGNNDWTDTVTLDPATQQALDAQQQVQENQSNLGETMQGQVANTMATPFNAPQLSTYMNGLPQVQTGFTGYTGDTPQASTNYTGYSTSQAPAVNMQTPTFDASTAQAGTQAAYNAETGLLQPQMQQDTQNLDAQLRLQGLTPGTQAYNNGMQNLQRTQDQTLTTAANQAVQTGDNEANQNYASALAGYNANVGAQAQDFGEGLSANNSQQTATNNANAAMAQNFGQDLGVYDTNQQALTSNNAAAEQDFSNQLNQYQAAYQSAFQNYMEPLNAMNAVLTGQQVSSPSFPGQSATTAGYTPGTDYSTAANELGQFTSGQTASANATQGSEIGAGASIAAAAAIAI